MLTNDIKMMQRILLPFRRAGRLLSFLNRRYMEVANDRKAALLYVAGNVIAPNIIEIKANLLTKGLCLYSMRLDMVTAIEIARIPPYGPGLSMVPVIL